MGKTLAITSSPSSIPPLNHHPPFPLVEAARAVRQHAAQKRPESNFLKKRKFKKKRKKSGNTPKSGRLTSLNTSVAGIMEADARQVYTMSNLLSNLQKLPKVRSCRPVYIVDQHRKNPKKIVERVAESEKEFQSKRLLCKVAQRFFFFFRSLNLPSRLLCDFYTCWPKIALRRQQHCLSAARRLRGKREKGRSQIEFAVLPAGWFFVSGNKIYCLVFALLLLSMY